MPPTAAERVDERYYEATGANSLAERLLVRARARIYQDFMACCRPTAEMSILDIGVSDVVNDGANLLERLYPHPGRITAAGLGEAGDFVKTYGVDRYVRIEANAPLPFADKSFDIATSNAVIEHVGGLDNQKALIAELRRVARQVFISAPNRWFPVEHHTAAPLAHYWRPAFVLACKAMGKSDWLDPANLTLIGPGDLRRLAPEARVGYTGLRLGPFSSNLFMHFRAD
jgi:hypothetical protein